MKEKMSVTVDEETLKLVDEAIKKETLEIDHM